MSLGFTVPEEGDEEGAEDETEPQSDSYSDYYCPRWERKTKTGRYVVSCPRHEVGDIETATVLFTLGEAGIKTLDDFADLSVDEVTNVEDGVLREYGLGDSDASGLIMAARAHWFDDEEAPAEASSGDGAEPPAAAPGAEGGAATDPMS